MKNRYDKVMKNIEVTQDMRDRILNNINNLDLDKTSSKIISFKYYKKYLYIAASIVFLFVSSIFLYNTVNSPDMSQLQGDYAKMGIMNHNTISELSEAVGFTIKTMQDVTFEIDTVEYTSYWGELAEVKYKGYYNMAVLRMALGNNDISGDYSEYNTIKNCIINGYNITFKGNNDKYNLAIWQSNGFSYSLQFVESVSEQEILTSIKSLQ